MFGTYVVVFLIWIAVSIVLGLILLALPVLARNSISSVIADTLILPFIALVVTLIYFRLSSAHGEATEAAPPGPGFAQLSA